MKALDRTLITGSKLVGLLVLVLVGLLVLGLIIVFVAGVISGAS